MRYHLTPIRWVLSKRQVVSVDEAVQKRQSSYTVGGNVKQCSQQYGDFSKN